MKPSRIVCSQNNKVSLRHSKESSVLCYYGMLFYDVLNKT